MRTKTFAPAADPSIEDHFQFRAITIDEFYVNHSRERKCTESRSNVLPIIYMYGLLDFRFLLMHRGWDHDLER